MNFLVIVFGVFLLVVICFLLWLDEEKGVFREKA